MLIKELELERDGRGSVSGFKFKQIRKSSMGYLYEAICSEGVKHWEVFKRVEKEEKNTVINGVSVHFDPMVAYPSDEAFGAWAWCFNKLENAEQRFVELSSGTEEFPL